MQAKVMQIAAYLHHHIAFLSGLYSGKGFLLGLPHTPFYNSFRNAISLTNTAFLLDPQTLYYPQTPFQSAGSPLAFHYRCHVSLKRVYDKIFIVPWVEQQQILHSMLLFAPTTAGLFILVLRPENRAFDRVF
jgi:hypothetical protein